MSQKLLTKVRFIISTNKLIYILYVEILSLEPKTKIWLLPMLTCLILGGQGLANSYLSGSTRTPLPFPIIAIILVLYRRNTKKKVKCVLGY